MTPRILSAEITKVVFLDFDGTINNPGCYRAGTGSYVPADASCIGALNHITDATGAAIVVSSTWRLCRSGLMFCREKLSDWGARAPVIDVTPRLIGERGILAVAQSRGAEIYKWLLENERYEIESFVILDDDSDMGPLMDRLVKTEGHIGLTMAHAERAIEMLNT